MKSSHNNDTFNARHLSPEEVASDFIPTNDFVKILDNENTLILGPRGSGKTTLLKMLQVRALNNWPDNICQKKADFIGIAVPADVRWAKQLIAHTNLVKDTEIINIFQQTALSLMIGISLVDTLEYLIHSSGHSFGAFKRLNDNREMEQVLVKRLAEIFRIHIDIYSLAALKHSFRINQGNLARATLEASKCPTINDVLSKYNFIGNGWLETFIQATETINDFLENKYQKWALLIDELEIIPLSLQAIILAALRSTSQNVILKVAHSPSGFHDALSSGDLTAPSVGNDYKTILLWFSDRKQLRDFAGQLLTSVLKKKNILDENKSLVDFFGDSFDWEGEVKDDSTFDSAKTKKLADIFVELERKDKYFKKYLLLKGINSYNLDISDKSNMGPTIRKIAPLATFRNYFIQTTTPEVKMRSRSGFVPYHGIPSLLDLTEGNPRWVLTLADDLISEYLTRTSIDAVQNNAIESYIKRFTSLLKVYPVGEEYDISLFDFLNDLGLSLHHRLYKKDDFS